MDKVSDAMLLCPLLYLKVLEVSMTVVTRVITQLAHPVYHSYKRNFTLYPRANNNQCLIIIPGSLR